MCKLIVEAVIWVEDKFEWEFFSSQSQTESCASSALIRCSEGEHGDGTGDDAEAGDVSEDASVISTLGVVMHDVSNLSGDGAIVLDELEVHLAACGVSILEQSRVRGGNIGSLDPGEGGGLELLGPVDIRARSKEVAPLKDTCILFDGFSAICGDRHRLRH